MLPPPKTIFGMLSFVVMSNYCYRSIVIIGRDNGGSRQTSEKHVRQKKKSNPSFKNVSNDVMTQS